MPFETSADRAVFLADFGVSATYQVEGGASAVVTGIRDAAFDAVFSGTERPTAGREGLFLMREVDLPEGAAPLAGDTLTIGADTFAVVEHRPDGEGMVSLALERGDPGNGDLD